MGIAEKIIEKRERGSINIRSQDELISACDAARIPREWYSFTYSDTVLVCKNKNTIYYGKHGETSNSQNPDSLYEGMYHELLRFKEIAEWEAQGLPYELLGIDVNLHYRFKKDHDKDYPYVIVQTEVFNKADAENMVAVGWKENGYDRYMDYYHLIKVEDIRNLIKNIVITFNKKTTDEDKAMFGFSDDYMLGVYSYDVPGEMNEMIAKSLFDNNGTVSERVKEKIFSHFSDSFIRDEFNGLCTMKNDFERVIASLNRGIDLSDEQIKNKLREQFKPIWYNNPAHCNYSDSRSDILEDFYYDKAYEKLELACAPKKGRNCGNAWKAFLNNN